MRQPELSSYLTDEESIKTRTALFYKYIYPYRNFIYHICIKRSTSDNEIQDNYNEVLLNFYRYIETYDMSRPIKSWIYTVASRYIFVLDSKSKRNELKHIKEVNTEDIEQFSGELLDGEWSGNNISLDNYQDLISDEVFCALQMLEPIYRNPLLLHVSGYKMEEIAVILYQQGLMKTPNIDTIKSRIFLCKKQLRKYLTRDGKLNRRETPYLP